MQIIEKHNALKIGSKVRIKPYINGDPNMGLEKYDMSLFEGIFHEEQLGCLETNGIKRYLTGLNEFAPDVQNITDSDEKEAAIKDIRETVAKLEKQLASNVLDVKDEQFWNKVKLLKPDNDDFWSKIYIRTGNEPTFLDPSKDAYDLIKIRAINAGGFSIVAGSLEAARSLAVSPKFYLDSAEVTASVKTEVKKMRNKALAELQKLFDKNHNKLFYVAKVIDANSPQYKKSTPIDILYDNMDNYINGLGIEKSKRKAAQSFVKAIRESMETLKLRAMIKDATYYKIIATRADGHIYHMKTTSLLGKNPSEVLAFIKNPLNEDILADITKNVEKYWNN